MYYSVFNSAPRAHRGIGEKGEQLARQYFEARGFSCMATNVSFRTGELDLVLKKDHRWHFVEVKYRRTLTYGHPVESVTWFKQKRIKSAVIAYLQRSTIKIGVYQVDLLAILDIPGQKTEYTYIPHMLEFS